MRQFDSDLVLVTIENDISRMVREQRAGTSEEIVLLAGNMATDVLYSSGRYNNRVAKNAAKYGEGAVKSTLSDQLLWGGFGARKEFSNPMLSSELTLEVMQPEVEHMARRVGIRALVNLCNQSGLGSRYYWKDKLKVPGMDSKADMHTFTREIWAPDYARRFTDAYIMQYYPDEFARTQTPVSELEQRELTRGGGMDMSDGHYLPLGMEN